jgi:uncharacterized protein YuzE
MTCHRDRKQVEVTTNIDGELVAMYVKLRDLKIRHTQEESNQAMVDYGKDGAIVGIEFLFK